MSHENAALVLRSFQEIGAEHVWDRDKIVLLFDHRIPANTTKAAEGHKLVREFVKKEKITNFYDLREGICHQVLPEKGHVRPGMLIVGSDSHTTTYGAFGAFSTGIGATEMASVWATGELWLKVPQTMRLKLNGVLHRAVEPKDVILFLIGQIKADGADYMSVEFIGPVVDEMSVSGRMVLSNMSMEMGAKNGVCFPGQEDHGLSGAQGETGHVPGRLGRGGGCGQGAGLQPDRPGTAGGLPASGGQRQTGVRGGRKDRSTRRSSALAPTVGWRT